MTVSRYQGKFTLVADEATELLSAEIVMYRSSGIEESHTDKTVLCEMPEINGCVFTYNAKAHPELGSGNRLLVTYNVNSFDTADLYEEVDNYRPRYIDVHAQIPNGQACEQGLPA